jgi:aquaporin Z
MATSGPEATAQEPVSNPVSTHGPTPGHGAGDEVGRLVAVREPWITDFHNGTFEWRRLFAELFGTFLLVVVAAGAGMVSALSHGAVSRSSEVVAPGLMVMAIILFMGKISGAHLNPAVSLAFAMRRDFPWSRVPGYVVAQLVGATLACLFLAAVLGHVGGLGANQPGPGVNGWQAVLFEALLTMGLVSTILGTASGAQNVGALSALAVAAYIILAGLWASPISGASMNPARSFGPDLVALHFANYWIYLIGPTVGSVLAAGVAYILRGPGGKDPSASAAAQGTINQMLLRPGQPVASIACDVTKP